MEWKKELTKDPVWAKYYECFDKYLEWNSLMIELKKMER